MYFQKSLGVAFALGVSAWIALSFSLSALNVCLISSNSTSFFWSWGGLRPANVPAVPRAILGGAGFFFPDEDFIGDFFVPLSFFPVFTDPFGVWGGVLLGEKSTFGRGGEDKLSELALFIGGGLFFMGVGLFIGLFFMGVGLLLFFMGVGLFIGLFFMGVGLFIGLFFMGVGLFIGLFFMGVGLLLFFMGVGLFIGLFFMGVGLFIGLFMGDAVLFIGLFMGDAGLFIGLFMAMGDGLFIGLFMGDAVLFIGLFMGDGLLIGLMGDGLFIGLMGDGLFIGLFIDGLFIGLFMGDGLFRRPLMGAGLFIGLGLFFGLLIGLAFIAFMGVIGVFLRWVFCTFFGEPFCEGLPMAGRWGVLSGNASTLSSDDMIKQRHREQLMQNGSLGHRILRNFSNWDHSRTAAKFCTWSVLLSWWSKNQKQQLMQNCSLGYIIILSSRKWDHSSTVNSESEVFHCHDEAKDKDSN